MKYTFEFEIEAPCDFVVKLHSDRQTLKDWQPELTEVIADDDERREGGECTLIYHLNGRRVEIRERVVRYDPPHELSAVYHTQGMQNHVVNRFAEINPDVTYWQHDCRWEFPGFLLKIVGWFAPQAFRNQSWRYCNLFKAYVERAYREHADDGG